MISRRNAIKVIFVLSSAIISFLLLEKWFKVNSLPKLLVLHQKKMLIAGIAELIIPRTDSPGAKDAKVEAFIINMIEFCSDRRTQNNFINGLQKLELYSVNEYGKDFMICPASEQLAVLTHFENTALYQNNILNKIRNKLIGKPFIMHFKELTVEGYCTSYEGATKGLIYDYIPVSYESCIPLNPNQRSWATK